MKYSFGIKVALNGKKKLSFQNNFKKYISSNVLYHFSNPYLFFIQFEL